MPSFLTQSIHRLLSFHQLMTMIVTFKGPTTYEILISFVNAGVHCITVQVSLGVWLLFPNRNLFLRNI